MLMSDPPPAYAEIHAALDIPVGSIGPQRARCLDRLRRSSTSSDWVRTRLIPREAWPVLEDWDDDQLMAALREATQARQAVPAAFVETARAAYAWHNIDAELAELSYDSSVDAEQGTLVRSETASVRTLTFSSARMSIELEVAVECCSARSSRRGKGRSRRRPGRARRRPSRST